jgi:hypothetical protein
MSLCSISTHVIAWTPLPTARMSDGQTATPYSASTHLNTSKLPSLLRYWRGGLLLAPLYKDLHPLSTHTPLTPTDRRLKARHDPCISDPQKEQAPSPSPHPMKSIRSGNRSPLSPCTAKSSSALPSSPSFPPAPPPPPPRRSPADRPPAGPSTAGRPAPRPVAFTRQDNSRLQLMRSKGDGRGEQELTSSAATHSRRPSAVTP